MSLFTPLPWELVIKYFLVCGHSSYKIKCCKLWIWLLKIEYELIRNLVILTSLHVKPGLDYDPDLEGNDDVDQRDLFYPAAPPDRGWPKEPSATGEAVHTWWPWESCFSSPSYLVHFREATSRSPMLGSLCRALESGFLWELKLSSKIFNYRNYLFGFWPIGLLETMSTAQSKLFVAGSRQNTCNSSWLCACFIVEVAIIYVPSFVHSSINSLLAYCLARYPLLWSLDKRGPSPGAHSLGGPTLALFFSLLPTGQEMYRLGRFIYSEPCPSFSL